MSKGIDPRRWTRDELIIALNVYYKLPFGQLHGTQPLIAAVAERMGRTPSSLSMKLCNLASLDPELQRQGKKGLPNASGLDRTVWREFHSDWDALVTKSEERLLELMLEEPKKSTSRRRVTSAPAGETESVSEHKQRIGQGFFRDTILAAYDSRCCISGNPVPELLRASHIVPWASDVKNRLNPKNGLCLAATYDAAFDRGLISFDRHRRLMLSKYLEDFLPDEVVEHDFWRLRGQRITMPARFEPDSKFLRIHRNDVFRKPKVA